MQHKHVPHTEQQETRTRAYVERPRFYEEVLAHGLIAYAKHDTTFARHAHDTIAAHFDPEDVQQSTTTSLKVPAMLIPSNADTARMRLRWLLSELEHTEKILYVRRALGMLSDVNQQDEPKNIVIGIVGVEIPGPTLGIIKHKKKKRMHLLLRPDIAENRDHNIYTTLNSAVLFVFERALHRAGGETNRLEPDVHEWFFDEKALSLYTADTHAFHALQHELTHNNIAYHTVEDSAGLSVLAVSPTVDGEVLESISGIEALD